MGDGDATGRAGPLPAAEIKDLPLPELLSQALGDPATVWRMGAFGAIGEFTRNEHEPAELGSRGDLRIATERGALQLLPHRELRLCAYELPGADADAWNHGVALCLPAEKVSVSRRAVLSELGLDDEAIRPRERSATRFDMGLGCSQADVCVRSADAATIERLRVEAGRSLLAEADPQMSDLPALSPHRVFVTRLGRLEVYQPIPRVGEIPPAGPRAYMLAKLLRNRRTHAATVPIPDGWVPCATFYPPNPVRDSRGQTKAFSTADHDHFQALLRRFGPRHLVELKDEVVAAVRGKRLPPVYPEGGYRSARGVVRVALRQLAHLDGPSPTLRAWQMAFDREALKGSEPDFVPTR